MKTERKTTVIHLDLLWAETTKDVTDPEIILTGVKSNSRKECGEQPLIEIRIKCNRYTPQYLVEIAAEQLRIKFNGIVEDCHSLAKTANVISSELTPTEL